MDTKTPIEICKSEDSLRKLYPHFSSKNEALSFYADYMRSTCSTSISQTCDLCASTVKVSRRQFNWQACYSTLSTGLGSIFGTLAGSSIGLFYSESMILSFETNHNLCIRCARKAKFMNGFGYIISNLGFALLFLALIYIVMSIAFGYVLLSDNPSTRDAITAGIIFISALLALALAILVCRSGHKFSMLSAFRNIGRNPFKLGNITL